MKLKREEFQRSDEHPLSIIVILFVVSTGNAFAQSNNTPIYSSLIPDDHLIFPSTTLTSNLNAESEKAIKGFVEL